MHATNPTLDQPANPYTRAREHIYAASKKEDTSAFGHHYRAYKLCQEPSITFGIIKSTVRDELHLRVAEAYKIQSRRLGLNRKQEDMGTGFLACLVNLYIFASHHESA